MALEDSVNFQSVYGLLFFGVPNRGIEISHWLPIVNNQPNENLVRNLAPGSSYLRSLQYRFCQVFGFHGSRIVSIYETMKSQTAKVCVENPHLTLLQTFLIYSEAREPRSLDPHWKDRSSGSTRLSNGQLPTWTETE